MGVKDSSNSLSAEPRVGLVSRLESTPGTAATHILQSPRGGSVSRLESVPDIVAAHNLQSQVFDQ